MSRREFEVELTKLLLRIIGEDGFALAGGQAAIAHGIVDRETEDIDLFSNRLKDNVLPHAASKAIERLQRQGYKVEIDEAVSNDSFFRAHIEDTSGERIKVELGYDYREWPTVQMDVGPVIDIRDFIASKLNAFCGREKIRDTIDTYGILQNGQWTEEQIVALAADMDSGFNLPLLAARLELEQTRPDSAFAVFEISPEQANAIRERMLAWEHNIRAHLNTVAQRGLDINAHPSTIQALLPGTDSYSDPSLGNGYSPPTPNGLGF